MSATAPHLPTIGLPALGLPELDLPGLDLAAHLAGVARDIAALAEEVGRVAVVVHDQGDLQWRSSAADRYCAEVTDRVDELRALSSQLDSVASAVRVLGAVAQRRLELALEIELPVIGILP